MQFTVFFFLTPVQVKVSKFFPFIAWNLCGYSKWIPTYILSDCILGTKYTLPISCFVSTPAEVDVSQSSNILAEK